ncbi:hypothetical protein [Roseobacter sp. S98]|uniref:hypothetical protein n=1 Tax=Roseobacter algicola (ex Choi et al. 2025) (nom. illeg.) TaxID=3092138 RepID=UPI003F51128B
MTDFLEKIPPEAAKRVSKVVSYCLVLNMNADNWHGLTLVLSARTTMQQRLAMAWAVLRALPPEMVVDVANSVLPERTCPPIPPLFSYMDEAAFWADMAEPAALDAYSLACFNAMSRPRKEAFFEFIQGRRAD